MCINGIEMQSENLFTMNGSYIEFQWRQWIIIKTKQNRKMWIKETWLKQVFRW